MGNEFPEIITICGSSRFKDEINRANAQLTLEGKLVISLGLFGKTDMPEEDWSTLGSTRKIMLDELHKRKIDLSDSIYVVNVNGYIGESTQSEIDYATQHHKRIYYMM